MFVDSCFSFARKRLPVLLLWFVSTPSDVPGELSSDAVGRFLQGLESNQREAALQASIPRFFNRDELVALLTNEAGAREYLSIGAR